MEGPMIQRSVLSYHSIDINTMREFVRSYLGCRLEKQICGNNHLYLGPPGIGKSETVVDVAREVAEEHGLRFWEFENASEPPADYEKVFVLVLFRLDMVKPEDLSGFPIPNKEDNAFDYATPRWAKVLRKAKGGLVVLDEFTNINDDTILSAAYDIVLSEKVNLFYFKKPVIALGNPPEVSSLARPLPLPLLNRLAVFNVREPSVEEWCDYMNKRYGDAWAKEVCTFLHAFSDFLLRVPEDPEHLSPYPTPRSWTSLALALYNAYRELYQALQEKKASARRKLVSLVAGFVGPEAAHAFVNWVFTSIPSVDQIVKDPSVLDTLSDDQLILVMQILAQHKHQHWKARITKVIDYLLKDSRKARYVAMLLRFMEDKRRKEYINYLKKNNTRVLFEIRSKIGGGELFGTR